MKKRLTIPEMLLDALLYTILIFTFIIQPLEEIYYSIEYKYASQWNINSTFVIAEPLVDGPIYQNEELTKELNTCKKMVYSTNLKEHYPELAWDKFDTVSIGYYSSNPEMQGNFIVLGEYRRDKNLIILTPYILQEDDLIDKYYTIIHELMHALFSNAQSNFQLQEGIADYFAYNISRQNGFSRFPSYNEEIRFFLLLCNIWGTKECIDMVLDDTLNQNIDKLTVEGSGKKFETLLYYIRNISNSSLLETINKPINKYDLIIMAQDIICHATRNYVKGIKDCDKRDAILKYCRDSLIISDDYFLEMLN